MNLPKIFEKHRQALDDMLRVVIKPNNSLLNRMMQYHMGWLDEEGRPSTQSSGKALRSVLCILACESAGGEPDRALPVAAAVELIHNYSLIHDDVQDNDRERRHRPTVWSIWGKPQAINAGTAMRMLANEAIRHLDGDLISLAARWRLQRLLDETTLRLIDGQCSDIAFEARFDVRIEEYIRMIEGKTAALISCSLESGALVASTDNRVVDMFRDLGHDIGLAFQIRDDILGIWGDERKTGKPSGSDILRKKKTLPVVYALNNGGQEISKIYGGRDDVTGQDFDRVMHLLESTGARKAAQDMVESYSMKAEDILRKMDLAEQAGNDLEEVIRFLTTRDH